MQDPANGLLRILLPRTPVNSAAEDVPKQLVEKVANLAHLSDALSPTGTYDAYLTCKGRGIYSYRPEKEREVHMADLAQLPAAFLENIAWVNQPPPPQARDTHALYFILRRSSGEGAANYQGFMFFRQGEHPTAPITAEQDGLDGAGHRVTVISGIGESDVSNEHWARVRVRFRTQPTARIDVVVVLHESEDHSGLPGTQLRLVEFDKVDFVSDDTILLDPGTSNSWDLQFTKTTVLP